MYLLGIDIGTSFIKLSLVDASTQKSIVTVQYPDTENVIISKQTGWAEQSPNTWWEQVQQVAGVLEVFRQHGADPPPHAPVVRGCEARRTGRQA
jgi:sugar (pentulose or hexulose) kinase